VEGVALKMDVDEAELERIEVRAIQGLYPEAHQALTNLGRWWRDRRGIFPTQARPGMWDEALPSKFGDFADDDEGYRPDIIGAEARA
jgi:hypothetical protein